MSAVMRLDHVAVTFRTGWGRGRTQLRAVDDVSLEVAAGQTLGLVGESGSGKSTTGSLTLGVRRPDSGRVLFDGEPFGRRRRFAGRVQAVWQNPLSSLNPRLSITQSVADPLRVIDSVPAGERSARAVRMLDRVGLSEHLADRRPHELSGGQRQRVAIARALVTNPGYIVFDEAVSALDVSVQAQILNLIRDLQAEHGFGCLFISHDLAAVRYVADRIAVMRAGRIVETADTETFYATPTHEYSRELLAAL